MTAAAPLARMIHLDGGAFEMESDRFYPEEAPARRVRVDPFWIDATQVTNGAFVAATGYVIIAEQPPDPKVYRDIDPLLAQPG